MSIYSFSVDAAEGSYLLAGSTVYVNHRYQEAGQGLSYSAGWYVLLEDTRVGGWDVVDVTRCKEIEL